MKPLGDILLAPFDRVLSKLDQYVIKKYVSTCLFTFGIITAIAVVIDYSEKRRILSRTNHPQKKYFLTITSISFRI